jgi:hypothetical protein
VRALKKLLTLERQVMDDTSKNLPPTQVAFSADDRLESVIARCEKFIGCHIVNGGALDARLIFAVERHFPGLQVTTLAIALSRFLAGVGADPVERMQ